MNKGTNTEIFDLDIVIVNYCSTLHTINCLKSLFKYIDGLNANVVVVDNNSNDAPVEILNHFKDVTLIRKKNNVGFGTAVNEGIRLTSSPFILLLNPDTILNAGFFNTVIDFMQSNREVGIAGPKIYEADSSVQGSARRFPTPLTSIFGRKSILSKIFPNNAFTRKEFMCFDDDKTEPYEVDWVSGACMLIRREAFQSVDGFDEDFFLYWEDADLCKRLHQKGWKITYFPNAEITHITARSSSINPALSNFYFHRSCYYYFKKHAMWPMRYLAPITFFALALRCCVVILFGMMAKNEAIKKAVLKKVKTNLDTSAEKIKILRIVSRLNIGGPSIHAAMLTKEFNNTQYASRLITGTVSDTEGSMAYLMEGHGHIMYQIPQLQRELQPIKDIITLVKMILIINAYKPDIVHTHMAKAGTTARIAVLVCNLTNRKKIKTVHTFHGHVLDGYFNHFMTRIFILIERLTALSTNSIIAISKTQKWELTEKYKIASPTKIDTIHLGFDLDPFVNANKQKGAFRAQLKIGAETLLVGIIGRLVPIKNHRLFLDSAKIFLSLYQEANVYFVIIGDGELRKELEAYAAQIGIIDHLYFHGWERNVARVYADLDILGLTSINEGTPVSIIEAMASRVPVVTTGVGGVKDLLGNIDEEYRNGDKHFKLCERGVLCPKGDPAVFARGLRYVHSRIGQKSIEHLTDRAQAFVLKRYSDSRLVGHIEELYQTMLSDR